MSQTVTPIASASSEILDAQTFVRTCHLRSVEAVTGWPRMSVDWFGPASDTWRDRAEELVTRIQRIEYQAQTAVLHSHRLEQ